MHQQVSATPPSTGIRLLRHLRPVAFWVRRYLPSEVAGTTLLLLAGTAVLGATGSPLRAALAASVAENLGFYSVAVGQVVLEQRRAGARGRALVLRSLRLAAAEYGPAEALDALARPTLIWLATLLVPQAVFALLVGKVIADAAFYSCAALAHRATVVLGWRQRVAGPVQAERSVPLASLAPPAPLEAEEDLDDDGGGGMRARRRRELADRWGAHGLQALVARHGSPLLVLDPAVAVASYRELGAQLPGVQLHYAVKALDHPDVLAALADAGARFDVASTAEAELLATLGVTGDRMLWTNPVATPAERAAAAAQGVRLFVVDNATELLKLRALPAGCRALVRLAHSDARAAVDLSGKFGADPATARRLVAMAIDHGVPVAGFSYHVGSQMNAVEPFLGALTTTLALVDEVESRHGIHLDVLDIGGGFPASYDSPATPLAHITRALRPVLAALDGRMTVIAEPGRAVVAEAGLAVTRVVSVAERPDGAWAYLDDGLYGSWSNVLTEHVRPLLLAAPELGGAPLVDSVTVAGPTCCGLDVIARAWPMPRLAVGDVVVSPTMGAYTSVTASSFNGRPPAAVVIVDSGRSAAAQRPSTKSIAVSRNCRDTGALKW
ncbi:Diaminopimelate decarboxylase [Quadrisphaera granulorum]|uniref:ornithine decarboxylase n=1 Tax=Quadrisphaera granulorum TaxID=317664 RepID=A0A316A802_9ACTN|nr:type III PLP-dependent enzyme [Quadrisphaera granulorum]PWJ54046.1 diaminopimelate decarboxylase [Quadrisphaera granulorum]SZE96503.1 Diaminopimelate decarboxylase [Quadrisphaera granulorum]